MLYDPLGNALGQLRSIVPGTQQLVDVGLEADVEVIIIDVALHDQRHIPLVQLRFAENVVEHIRDRLHLAAYRNELVAKLYIILDLFFQSGNTLQKLRFQFPVCLFNDRGLTFILAECVKHLPLI